MQVPKRFWVRNKRIYKLELRIKRCYISINFQQTQNTHTPNTHDGDKNQFGLELRERETDSFSPLPPQT